MPIRWAFLKRVLAGAIFGLYMAHLLYFLNPQVDVTVFRLAIVTLVYGAICGILFGSVLWGLRALRVRLFGRPEPYRTHGFGFVVFAAFVASFIYLMHLQLLRGYLPVGALRNLSKATNLITAAAFILLALWVIERNAQRTRSRAIFVTGFLLIAMSSVFLYQRRESFRTERKEVVFATIGAVAERNPVLLVSIRNLPYDWIVTMKGEGLLPFFDRATEEAFFTRVDPFRVTTPKTLWASLATGKLPHRHRITGRFSYRTPLNREEPFLLLPYGVGFRTWGLIPPVERISTPVPSGAALPIWSIFRRMSLEAEVVRWPDVPASPLPSTTKVEDPRFAATGEAAAISAALSDDLGILRSVRRSVGDAALTTAWLEGFSAAQRELHVYRNDVPQRGTATGDALRVYAQELDGALGELVRAHPGHIIIICSPSAVSPPPMPANAWAMLMNALKRAQPGADDGFILISGPGVTHREHPEPAQVTDVVPTLLFAAGLPIGRDMDGRIITDAFSDEVLRRSTLSAIQTYEAERVVVRRDRP